MYIAKALTAKEEHKKRYPGYRYRPRKRGTKTAVAKTGDANSPSTSGSPSSSSTSSSASTPAPTTPVTIMPAAGSSTVGNAFGFNFGGGLNLNHRPGAHATGQLPNAPQSNDYLWSPQAAGWTDPSTSISMPQNDSLALLLKGDEVLQGLFKAPFYQPHASYAPPQAASPFAPGLQLQTGIVNQQPPQPPPQQTVQPAPQRSLQQACQTAFNPVSARPQAQAYAVPVQAQSESLLTGEELQTTQLEAWDKEFAPLDAGFCNFSSAWNDVKASNTPTSGPGSSTTPLPATEDGPLASAALPPTVAGNLNVNVDGDQVQALRSQTQDPSLFSPSAFFDPSLLFPFGDLLGQQYNDPYDPFQSLPPSAVWPEELNTFGINA